MEGLNRTQLKYIAIIAMLIDHIATIFIAETNPYYHIFLCVGCITAPIMTYFVVEGYIHTSSRKRYGMRLLLFSIISQAPYMLAFDKGIYHFNMIFTLLLSFLAIVVYDSKGPLIIKLFIISLLITMSIFCDWMVFIPLWALLFYIFRDNQEKKVISFIAVTVIIVCIELVACKEANLFTIERTLPIARQLFTILSIPLLILYNGEAGDKSKFSKWFFYIFYPLHLLILAFINLVL